MQFEGTQRNPRDQAHTGRGLLDLNHASKDDLSGIPGVNEQDASELLRFRDQRGGIRGWKDFDEMPLSEHAKESLRPMVRF